MTVPRILIVEDEAIEALDIKQRLEGMGYQVVGVAHSGEQGVRQAKELSPGLVLMDIMLSGKLDGVMAAEQIRSRFDIPIIYLTAYADEDTLQRAKITEPYAYLVKPFQERELHIAIEIALYRYEVERRLKERKKELEALLRERGVLVEDLQVYQVELETQAEELHQQTEELHQAQAKIREARNKYLDLYDYAPVGYLTMRKDSLVLEANLAIAKLLGLKMPELLNSRFNKMIAPDFQEEFSFHLKRVIETGRDECELSVKKKNGEQFYVQLTSIVMDSGKKEKTILTTLMDITERKKAEEIKNDFIGMVSHEIRTPLTVISGSLRTAMTEGIAPEDKEEMILSAIEGTSALTAIVENLVELSKHQSGRLQLNIEPQSISATVEGVIKQLKDRGASQQFILHLPADLPQVKADAMRLERILYNLLENAVKYSSEESDINIRASSRGGEVVIRITDQGLGISRADQGRLFQVFERLENDIQPPQGLGLGLVVCKHLVEAQEGHIWVESEAGKGSTFCFALPAADTS
ncbi:MAG: ATP-binding protein [Dehalococcoidales bacterium]|nr:ATP-binding protein [Dehalococcoidales bacterium]